MTGHGHKEIREDFQLKNVGPPDYYLGGNVEHMFEMCFKTYMSDREMFLSGAVSGNFRCGEFFPKAVGRGRGVGQGPTERRRRKFFGGLIGFYSIFN